MTFLSRSVIPTEVGSWLATFKHLFQYICWSQCWRELSLEKKNSITLFRNNEYSYHAISYQYNPIPKIIQPIQKMKFDY